MNWRYRRHTNSALIIELDSPADETRPAFRVDLPLQLKPAAMKQWLACLGNAYEGDTVAVSYGWWGDAKLVLEDRGVDRQHGAYRTRLVVEVTPPSDDWSTPVEWEGAVEVTDDPAWSRPLLTTKSWPLLFAPIKHDEGVTSAWGAALDPSREEHHCDVGDSDSDGFDSEDA